MGFTAVSFRFFSEQNKKLSGPLEDWHPVVYRYVMA